MTAACSTEKPAHISHTTDPQSGFHCQEADFGPQTWRWFISKDRHHNLVQPSGDLPKYEAGCRIWTRKYPPNLADNTSSSLKQKYKYCDVSVQIPEPQKLRSFTEYNRNTLQTTLIHSILPVKNKKKKVNESHYRPEVPRGFQEVKVPRLRDIGRGWW